MLNFKYSYLLYDKYGLNKLAIMADTLYMFSRVLDDLLTD